MKRGFVSSDVSWHTTPSEDNVEGGYVEISVVVSRETEEALGDFLFSEGALGLVTEDVPEEPSRIRIRASFSGTEPTGSLIERLRGYQAELAALKLSVPDEPIEVREIPLEDWGRNWKQHFKPLSVGRRLVIAPPWEQDPLPEGRLLIRIDPAMAFGTGHHATTRMCLEALEAFMDQWSKGCRPIVLDVGTGTAILAIAAARLGAERVVAIDTDPQACDAARKNLGLNEGAGSVQVIHGGMEDLEANVRFDLVLANLDTKTLCPLFPTIASVLKAEGRLVVSGILDVDDAALTAALQSSRLLIIGRLVEEEWLCLTLAPNGI